MESKARHQKSNRVKDLPLDNPSIEAWTSSHPTNTADNRCQKSESFNYTPKVSDPHELDSKHQLDSQTKYPSFKLSSNHHNLCLFSSCHSSVSKPIPPAHGIAQSRDWKISGGVYQPEEMLKPKFLQHQGNTMNRFSGHHPRRVDGVDDREVKEILRINPIHLFYTGFLPPFIGAVASIIVALVLHNDEISNYNWQCGVGHILTCITYTRVSFNLESSSTIAITYHQFANGENLLAIHVFVPRATAYGWISSRMWGFQSALSFIPLFIVFRYGQLRSVDTRFPRIYTATRYFYAIIGVLELIFMVALSVVGEREFIGSLRCHPLLPTLLAYHVIFFYAFGLSAIGFFATNVFCHSSSLYYLNPYVSLFVSWTYG